MASKIQLITITILLALSTFGCYFRVTDEKDDDADGHTKEILSESFMLSYPPTLQR